MVKSIETTGKTEDEAIAAALKQLEKSREEVSVEVLERSRSGFLGIGAVPARSGSAMSMRRPPRRRRRPS